MAKPKLNIIRPVLSVIYMPDGDLLSRLNAVHDGMLNNPAYPNPPAEMTGFKAAIDAYTATAAIAALDGCRVAIVERDKRRADVVIMLRLIGHYVEAACKNDMTTFGSSGFVAASTARTPAQPVSTPSIARVDQGITGQLLVKIQSVPRARTYELRYAPVPGPGATVSWTTMPVATTKPATAIDNLTPGVKYTFQVRAFGKLRFSDWSASIERMCI